MDPYLLILLCLIPGLVLGQTDVCPTGLQICFNEFNSARQAAGTDIEQECSAALNVTLCLELLKPMCSSATQGNVDGALSGIQNDYVGPPKNCSLDTDGMVVSVTTCDALFQACGNAKANQQDSCSTVPSHQTCLQSMLASCDPAMNSTGQSYIQILKNFLSCNFDAVLTTARTVLSGADCGTVFTDCHSGHGDENDICSVVPRYEYCAETVVSSQCDRQTYLQILAFIAQTQDQNNCPLNATTSLAAQSTESAAQASTSSLAASSQSEVEPTSPGTKVASTDQVSNAETQGSSVEQSSDVSSQRPPHSSSQPAPDSSTSESSASTASSSLSPSAAQDTATPSSSPQSITYDYSGATRPGSTVAAGRLVLGSMALLLVLL